MTPEILPNFRWFIYPMICFQTMVFISTTYIDSPGRSFEEFNFRMLLSKQVPRSLWLQLLPMVKFILALKCDIKS